jgi:hypothetical protein
MAILIWKKLIYVAMGHFSNEMENIDDKKHGIYVPKIIIWINYL